VGTSKSGHTVKKWALHLFSIKFQGYISVAAERTAPRRRTQSGDFTELSCDLLCRFPTESVSFLNHDFNEKNNILSAQKPAKWRHKKDYDSVGNRLRSVGIYKWVDGNGGGWLRRKTWFLSPKQLENGFRGVLRCFYTKSVDKYKSMAQEKQFFSEKPL